MLRQDGRDNNDLRKCRITRNINDYAEGSCLIVVGNTRVHCTASVEDRQPHFLRDTEKGWVTAEYSMLPRATNTRNRRERDTGPSGRSQEIQRLIGRSLRVVCDTNLLGPRTIQIDCDVMQADGGTRTAAITGAFVALADACAWLRENKGLKRWPLLDQVAATSLGIVSGEVLLDLAYVEAGQGVSGLIARFTGRGGIVEVQGTGERAPFSRQQLDAMVELGAEGCRQLFEIQREALGDVLPG